MARARRPSGARRLAGWAVLLLLALAAAGLFLHGRVRRPAPLQRIGALQPERNGTRLRVQGRAAGHAQVTRTGGRISGLRFVVDDGSGRLPVTADAATARQLALWDRVPRSNDAVTVTGRLNGAANGEPSLQLQAEEDLRLSRQTPPATLPPAEP